MGVQQRPCRAAGQGRGPQVRHRLLHLAPRGRGRVGQQLGSPRGVTGGNSERLLGESECSVDDSGDSESAKSFCINRKKARKKILQLGEIVLWIEHSIILFFCFFFFFFCFLGFSFFLAQPNVFFETNTGLNRE